MTTISNADKLACVKRELAMRRRIYPQWVKVSRMTQAMADKEIATMEAIVADYQRLTSA